MVRIDITMIGSLGAYLKNIEKQAQWNLKKESGEMTDHSNSLDEWLNDQETPPSSAQAVRNTEDSKLQGVYQKLYSGKSLTSSEKTYLQEKDPMAYEKAKSIEEERKSYEQALKRCRTKEDVQRLKMSYLNSSMSAVNAIRNDPHITEEKKLEFIALENGEASALAKVAQEFVRRGYYDTLPTDAEKNQAEQELEEEAKPERKVEGLHTERGRQQDRNNAVESASIPCDTPRKEEDPELIRKVKRSKAVAAYAQLGGDAEAEVSSMENTRFDSQA